MLVRPTFSIVLLNFNGIDWLPKCIESLKNQDYSDFEIIFVDNGSTDRSIDYINRSGITCNICSLSSNVGFCLANNLGSQLTQGEWLIFLSNDTWIESDFLSRLAECARQDHGDIIVPRVLEYEENNDEGQIGYIQDLLGYGLSDENREPFWCLGCCFIIRKNAWNKCGGFDKDFWAFHEDLDLSWRAQLLGFTVRPANDARIHHYGGGTFGKVQIINGGIKTNSTRRYLGERNRIACLVKNYSMYSLAIFVPILLIQTILAYCILRVVGERSLAKSYLDAWIWNVKHIKKTLLKRKIVQESRVKSDKDIILSGYLGLVELERFIAFGVPKSI